MNKAFTVLDTYTADPCTFPIQPSWWSLLLEENTVYCHWTVCFPPWIKSDHRLLTLKPYSLGRYFFQYFHKLPLTTIGGSRVGRLWKVSKCKSKSLVKFWLLPYLVHTKQMLFPTIKVLVLHQCSDKGQMFKMSVLKPYYGDNLQLIKPK